MESTDMFTERSVTQPDAQLWDEFIKWAKRFYEWDEFDEMERTYKLVVAERVKSARNAVLNGANGWQELIKTAFGSPNNLTNWRIIPLFLKWCRDEPLQAVTALRVVWDSSLSVEDRFDGFVELTPKDEFRISIAEASFLHMAIDPLQYPIYRATPVAGAMKLVSFHDPYPWTSAMAGRRYVHFLSFLDRVMAEAAGRGLVLRDRLDAQGVMQCITRKPPVDSWSEEDKAAFGRYQG